MTDTDLHAMNVMLLPLYHVINNDCILLFPVTGSCKALYMCLSATSFIALSAIVHNIMDSFLCAILYSCMYLSSACHAYASSINDYEIAGHLMV